MYWRLIPSLRRVPRVCNRMAKLLSLGFRASEVRFVTEAAGFLSNSSEHTNYYNVLVSLYTELYELFSSVYNCIMYDCMPGVRPCVVQNRFAELYI